MGTRLVVAASLADPNANKGEVADEGAQVAAAQKDQSAFTPLYQRYVAPVYRYLYSRTGNAADAEDLTAQVFLEALQGLPRYRHRGHFAAWLFTIARRRAVDHYRRQPVLLPLDDVLTPSDKDNPLDRNQCSKSVLAQ